LAEQKASETDFLKRAVGNTDENGPLERSWFNRNAGPRSSRQICSHGESLNTANIEDMSMSLCRLIDKS
jgi:hypothetical protein